MRDQHFETARGRQRAGRAAFTLIELLVAISIIAVLVGLLIPMVMKGRMYAQRAGCLSNQRQIGMMTFQYMDNHEGAFPPYYPNAPSDSAQYYGASPLLQEYLPEMGYRIYICPSSVGKPVNYWDGDKRAPQGGPYAWNGGREYSSYGYNTHLRCATMDWWDTSAGAGGAVNFNTLTNPSKTFWTADTCSGRFDWMYGQKLLSAYRHGGGPIPIATEPDGNGPDFQAWVDKPNAAGFNAGFADGHARWVKYHGEFKEWCENWQTSEVFLWR